MQQAYESSILKNTKKKNVICTYLVPTHTKVDIGRSVDKEKPLFYRVKICSIVVLAVFFFAWRNFFCTFFFGYRQTAFGNPVHERVFFCIKNYLPTRENVYIRTLKNIGVGKH